MKTKFKIYNAGVFFRPDESKVKPKGWVLSYNKKRRVGYFQPLHIEHIEIPFKTKEEALLELDKLTSE